ncbi:MAG: hypothetical protein ABI683_09780 [Ginsengibacter sp.]
MKNKIGWYIGLFIFVFLFSSNGFAISVTRSVESGENAVAPTIDYLKASVFVKLSPRQFTEITGKKLNLPQRIYFKIIQRRLKHELKSNPNLSIAQYYDVQNEKFKFDALWFVLATFIGPFGVLLAYTFRLRKGGPTRKNRIISAWLGFILFVLWFGFSFLF